MLQSICFMICLIIMPYFLLVRSKNENDPSRKKHCLEGLICGSEANLMTCSLRQRDFEECLEKDKKKTRSGCI